MFGMLAITGTIFGISLLRSGQDGAVVVLGGLGGALVLGVVVVTRVRSEDRRRDRLAKAVGGLFGATGTIRLQEVRSSPMLAPSFSNTDRASLSHGLVTGDLLITRDGFEWTPNRRAKWLRVPAVKIQRSSIVAVDAGGLPGVGDPAVVAVRLTDGSVVSFITRRLVELRNALAQGGYAEGVV